MNQALEAILQEEDRQFFEALDTFANRGHKMHQVFLGSKKRVVHECSRCGFRIRGGRKRKSAVPECPLAIVERIMEC